MAYNEMEEGTKTHFTPLTQQLANLNKLKKK